MNPYLDAPPAPTRPQPPLGSPPPALIALTVVIGVAVVLASLGLAFGAALGLGAIAGSVAGLVAAALRIAHDWVDDPGQRPGD